MGDSLRCQRHFVSLAGLFCGEEVEKNLGYYSFMPFLDNLEGEK